MENKRSVRRKNRKIKFSEDRYVDKYYMRDGKAVIPVQLDRVSDLYMEHDYKQMELSDSVCKYIEEIAYMFPIDTDIILEIHCPEVDEDTKDRMKKSIRNNYGIEIDDVEYEIMLQNRRSFILLIVGVVLLTMNNIFELYMGSIASNFLCVVWWVAIWDMIEIQILDKGENRWKRLNYQQLYDAEITFVCDIELLET
ncbi:MAG: hypothetical protein IJ193_03030 [Bacilli bacterium]|nr:hypothetical protein [Bacilli bacterium]